MLWLLRGCGLALPPLARCTAPFSPCRLMPLPCLCRASPPPLLASLLCVLRFPGLRFCMRVLRTHCRAYCCWRAAGVAGHALAVRTYVWRTVFLLSSAPPPYTTTLLSTLLPRPTFLTTVHLPPPCLHTFCPSLSSPASLPLCLFTPFPCLASFTTHHTTHTFAYPSFYTHTRLHTRTAVPPLCLPLRLLVLALLHLAHFCVFLTHYYNTFGHRQTGQDRNRTVTG